MLRNPPPSRVSRRRNLRQQAWWLLTAAALCLSVAPAEAATYCRAFGLTGFACPSGATSWCDDVPLDPTSATQAKKACEVCYGIPTCFLSEADCAGPGYGPTATPSAEAFFGYAIGCSGEAGRIWHYGGSFTTHGYWAPDTESTDSDGDGVPDLVEDGAPNGGDGNSDKELDRTQGWVASFPAAGGDPLIRVAGTGYLTLFNVNDCSGQLLEVEAVDEASLGGEDDGYDYPYGLVRFKVTCGNAELTLIVHDAESLGGLVYRKYGPIFDDMKKRKVRPPKPRGVVGDQYYTYPSETASNKVMFTLKRDQTGDATLGDDDIVDPSGLAAPVAPAMPLAATGLLGLALAAGALTRIRRRR